MFTNTGASIFFKTGNFSFTNASSPTFSRPMALSMPHGVSTILGGGFPLDASRDNPFTIMPPRRFKSISFSNSPAYPKVPDAVSTGFFNVIPPIFTRISDFFLFISTNPFNLMSNLDVSVIKPWMDTN